MPRTPEEVEEDRRRCRMAAAVNTAMARDVPVVLSDHLGNLIAEGRIIRRERSEPYGVVVFVEDVPGSIPLPFIKKMALSERS